MPLLDGTLDQQIYEASSLVTVIPAEDFEADQRDGEWHELVSASEAHLKRLQEEGRAP